MPPPSIEIIEQSARTPVPTHISTHTPISPPTVNITMLCGRWLTDAKLLILLMRHSATVNLSTISYTVPVPPPGAPPATGLRRPAADRLDLCALRSGPRDVAGHGRPRSVASARAATSRGLVGQSMSLGTAVICGTSDFLIDIHFMLNYGDANLRAPSEYQELSFAG